MTSKQVWISSFFVGKLRQVVIRDSLLHYPTTNSFIQSIEKNVVYCAVFCAMKKWDCLLINLCNFRQFINMYIQERRNMGGSGGFWKISQHYLSQGGGADYAHHITSCPTPRIFRPSYGLVFYWLLQPKSYLKCSRCFFIEIPQ